MRCCERKRPEGKTGGGDRRGRPEVGGDEKKEKKEKKEKEKKKRKKEKKEKKKKKKEKREKQCTMK